MEGEWASSETAYSSETTWNSTMECSGSTPMTFSITNLLPLFVSLISPSSSWGNGEQINFLQQRRRISVYTMEKYGLACMGKIVNVTKTRKSTGNEKLTF